MTTATPEGASLITPGQSMRFEHEGQAILVANVDGTFCAISSTCPHRGADLSKGTIDDGIVTCPKHGAKFDLRTGKNVGGAKILGVSTPTKDVQSFTVTVEGTSVLVDVP